jgi:hypothetical protein
VLNTADRNLVFANATYTLNPPPVWQAKRYCMAGVPAEHTHFTQQQTLPVGHPQLQQAGHDSVNSSSAANPASAAAGFGSSSGKRVEQSVMFAAAPDSSLFQHFMDRTAMMLAQTEALRSSDTKYIALQPR